MSSSSSWHFFNTRLCSPVFLASAADRPSVARSLTLESVRSKSCSVSFTSSARKNGARDAWQLQSLSSRTEFFPSKALARIAIDSSL
uniref:Uncharacterized protein n=1 Tax=Ixodes ricinus TaxID=34613 RepID=A0A6B0U1N8_IXORI